MVCISRSMVVLTLVLACGGGDGGTGMGTGTGATNGSGTEAGSTLGGASSTTVEQPTGGSGGASEGASGSTGGSLDPSGSGTGGEGSGAACVAWYGSIYDSYGPICACQVQMGVFPDEQACVDALAPPSDCACMIFAQAPETADLLHCYESAAKDRADCVGAIDVCPLDVALAACDAVQAEALAACGTPPMEVCTALKMDCQELPALLCPG